MSRNYMRGGGLLVAALLVTALPLLAAEAVAEEERVLTPVEARGEAYTYLMRAVFAAREGEFRTATNEVRAAVALEPESAPLLIQGGNLLLWMGRRQEAEELGAKALEIAPEDPGAIRFVADLAASRALGSRPDEAARAEAIRLYDKLRALGEEDDDDLLRRLISLYLQDGDREAALDAAQRLAKIRPGDLQVTELLVKLLTDQGDYRAALEHALEYVVRHPAESPLLDMAEQLAQELEAWSLVDEILSGEDGIGDRPVAAQGLRAEALLRLDRIDEATRAWEATLKVDPGDRRARFNLATAYRRVGRLADAVALARGLAEETPDDPRAQLFLGELLETQGNNREALEAFAQALSTLSAPGREDTRPFRELVRGRMILLYLDEGRIADAEALAARIEQKERPEVVEVEGAIAIARKDWSLANEKIRRLRSLGETGGADLMEAEILIRSGRWSKAAPKAEEAIAALGPGARIRLSELYREFEQPEEGEALLRDWVKQEPGNPNAHFQLGSYLYRTGDFAGAEPELRETFRIDPTHSQALNFLGYSLAERNERLDEAVDLIEQALGLEEWNGAYLDSLGWAYHQMGRYEEAREPLERAAREFPMDPVVLEHLGDVYRKLGEPDLAVVAWTRALAAGAEEAAALQAKIDTVKAVVEEAAARNERGPDVENAE